MAKRKIARRRRTSLATSKKGAVRRRSKSKSQFEKIAYSVAWATAFGTARPILTAYARPYTSKIGVVGNYVDEASMLAIGYGLNHFGKGTVKKFGKTILEMESTLIGLKIGTNVASNLVQNGMIKVPGAQ